LSSESILKPLGDETPNDTTEEIKDGILLLFKLDSAQISMLFSELTKSKETFTNAKVADLLSQEISPAAEIYDKFLHIIHMHSTHQVTTESVKKDLASLGCDEAKVEAFLREMESLDDNTRRAADALDLSTMYVDEEPHINELGYSMLYREMGDYDEEEPHAVLPIVVLELKTREEENGKYVVHSWRIQIPITEMDRLVRSFQNLTRDAKKDVTNFKKNTGIKAFVPEG
jgi:hypothetical protein